MSRRMPKHACIGGLQLAAILVDIAKHTSTTAQEFDTDTFYKCQ